MSVLLYVLFLLQYEVTFFVGFEVSDEKVCDMVFSKNRGILFKFHAAVENSKCKGLVRFKTYENETYCIPIVDGKNDILNCPVSSCV